MRVGVDVVAVDRIARLLQRRRQFAARAFTEQERETCAGRPERFAARWAAKEAVRKLRSASGLGMPSFRDIEVLGGVTTAPSVRIEGREEPIELSLTHDAGMAIAVVAGGRRGRPTVAVPDGLRLPDRPDDAHKGTFGHVVAMAGSRGYTGAPRLAAFGAARAGAGLVTLCVPESIYPIVAVGCLEVMPAPLPDAGTSALHPAALGELATHLERATAAVIGPGLGRADATGEALLELLETLPCTAVIDADGLNIAAAARFDWRRCPVATVLTPHPAEMARLVGMDTAAVQRDREGMARRFASERGVIMVLKGSRTVVAAPDGRLHMDEHHVVALASGGTGDVLGGVIAAFIAQGLDPFDAAVAGVTVHAEAGMAVQRRRGRAGALASDVIEALPAAQEQLRRALEGSAKSE